LKHHTKQHWMLAGTLALVAGAVVLAQGGYSFLINNKNVKLETLEKNGKVFVEVNSFAQSLGAKVAFDKAKRSFTVSTGDAAATTPAQAGTQLAGGQGAIGKSYTLGKDGPVNFTLKSAEFSVSRYTLKDLIAPKFNQKLLVLRFTVQNPSKADLNIYYGSLDFTAVDDKDQNVKFENYWSREGETTKLDIGLKPAQKIEVIAVAAVPANAKIPKLIVQRGGETKSPVVRYDLSGKIKPLVAPFTDPADPSGSTALEVIPAKAGTFYPMGAMDMKLEEVAFSADKIDGKTPSDGKRFLIATFAVKSAAVGQDINVSYSRFGIELTDAEGSTKKFDGYIIKPSRDEKQDVDLKPGSETKFRAYFELPKDLGGKTLSINENGVAGQSRAYTFDVSALK
jgi:hypothetical protein